MPGSITSANSVVTITVNGLVPPTQLQGFAADEIFDTPQIKPAEVVMGADGVMSAGWIPVPVEQNFSLMPGNLNDDSIRLFEIWAAANAAARSLFFATGVIYLPSTGRTYVCSNGVLTGYTVMPDAKKVLQAVKFGITWEVVTTAPG